ncbi:hypothetical protein D9M68_1006660 [compost metagenome]
MGYTFKRNESGYFPRRAFTPSDSFAALLSMSLAVMVRTAFSLANGSGRGSPDLYPAGGVTPASFHAGMLPSALPARSAPTGVRVLLSS